MVFKKFKFSDTKKREFAKKMKEIEDFCSANGISSSRNNDSYYFMINGKSYRVSNHTIEMSNRNAYDEFGNKIREEYHGSRDPNTIYIHASKLRIIEIYTDLKNGFELDGKGNRKG